MVLRKNVPEGNPIPAPLSQAKDNPPYPTTPSEEHPPNPYAGNSQQMYSSDLNTSPAFKLKPVNGAQKHEPVVENESDYSDNEWDQSDDDAPPQDLPDPQKIGGGKTSSASVNHDTLPDALRAGPPAGIPIRKPLPAVSPEPTGITSSSYGAASTASGASLPLQTNNPYLKMQHTGQSNFGAETSQQVWGDAPSQTQPLQRRQSELAELPTVQTPVTPTHDMASLMLDSKAPAVQSSISPDQPPLIAVQSASPQSPYPRHDSNASEAFDPGMDISSIDAFARTYGLPEDNTQDRTQRTWEQQQEWEKNERERKQREMAAAQEAANRAEQERRHEDEFHRLENVPRPIEQATSLLVEEEGPALPPRRSGDEHPPGLPPRPLETGIINIGHRGPESPNTVTSRQKAEHYQIKHIRWHDIKKQGIRTSPIMTQNLNGPCPLLALVNALVLSTPTGVDTALLETLRARDQVSLGLLLDAVVDELLSGRRGEAAQGLSDPSQLYSFLLALHTGMNVNPMFVQEVQSNPNSTLRERPGVFEDTRDMKLYRTFSIPLMHGWLPEINSEAYRAFDRIAKTYETSQYVQFQEEELDLKLERGDPLTTDEQQMFTDIHAIKEFLNLWPTQLTTYGLKTIQTSLQAGEVAILFRNDHFSTLYKDPRTDHLVTLVTDQGYSTHDEIVWESLVDVNGQGSELFSGDFRPVGNNNAPLEMQGQPPVQNLLDVDHNKGWTTVPSRRGNQQAPSPGLGIAQNTGAETVESGRVEQEDHDLALALQLQEEEDDRHRRSQDERRRRENQLSQDAIAAQAQARPSNNRITGPGEAPPAIPPRRSNMQTHRPSNEPAPPPTYAEASQNPPYNPLQGRPPNGNTPLRPQGSAYQQANQGMGPDQGGRFTQPMPHNPSAGRPGWRQNAGGVGPNGSQDKDKCVVM